MMLMERFAYATRVVNAEHLNAMINRSYRQDEDTRILEFESYIPKSVYMKCFSIIGNDVNPKDQSIRALVDELGRTSQTIPVLALLSPNLGEFTYIYTAEEGMLYD